jgi:hypothetical protein
MLEQRGLLKRIGVVTHPRADDGLPPVLFTGEGLVMSLAFNAAMKRPRLSVASMPHVARVQDFSKQSCSGESGRRRKLA